MNVSTILSPILGIGQLYCFCVLTDRDVVEVNKHTHTHTQKDGANIKPSWPKKLGQYTASVSVSDTFYFSCGRE